MIVAGYMAQYVAKAEKADVEKEERRIARKYPIQDTWAQDLN